MNPSEISFAQDVAGELAEGEFLIGHHYKLHNRRVHIELREDGQVLIELTRLVDKDELPTLKVNSNQVLRGRVLHTGLVTAPECIACISQFAKDLRCTPGYKPGKFERTYLYENRP